MPLDSTHNRQQRPRQVHPVASLQVADSDSVEMRMRSKLQVVLRQVQLPVQVEMGIKRLLDPVLEGVLITI
jgi:hypothetical protein